MNLDFEILLTVEMHRKLQNSAPDKSRNFEVSGNKSEFVANMFQHNPG